MVFPVASVSGLSGSWQHKRTVPGTFLSSLVGGMKVVCIECSAFDYTDIRDETL